ncbi:ATP-binding protein [soil metagenome]
MRVAVLPREIAARVITSGVARGAWAVNATSLGLTIPILISFLGARGLESELGVPLSILVGLMLLAIAAALVPKPWVVIAFLVIGAASAVIYELSLIAVYPAIQQEGLFLLNRPAVSLVLIGVAGTTTRTGVLWSAIGFVVSMGVPAVVSLVTGRPFLPGWGALLIFAVYVVAYLVLAAIQVQLRRQIPDFDRLEEETRRLEVEENLRKRLAATVHYTLLNYLSIVMTAPDELDQRVTERLRADIRTLTSAEWLRESAEVAIDEQDSSLRNQIMMMMSDLQWRGLTVHVTGSGNGIYRLAPDTATALIDAVRACLENVLRHSGVTVAEVDLAYDDQAITVVVADQGVGFDPDAVAPDRLGLSHSVVERVRSVGGSVRVWSTPGAGASIVMRIPVLEVVTSNEESDHAHS